MSFTNTTIIVPIGAAAGFQTPQHRVIIYMDLELANKSVVITGGASNIGRAITLLFAEESARIYVADIDMQSAIEVAELAKCRGAAAAHECR